MNGVTIFDPDEGAQKSVKVLKDIRAFLPVLLTLHAQVVSEGTDKMVEEAHFMLNEIREDLFINGQRHRYGWAVSYPSTPKKEGMTIMAGIWLMTVGVDVARRGATASYA